MDDGNAKAGRQKREHSKKASYQRDRGMCESVNRTNWQFDRDNCTAPNLSGHLGGDLQIGADWPADCHLTCPHVQFHSQTTVVHLRGYSKQSGTRYVGAVTIHKAASVQATVRGAFLTDTD
jgi:hypothetical protein